MPKINLERTHEFSPDIITEKADKLVNKLQEKLSGMSMQYEWRGDKSGIDFKGNGFKGNVELLPGKITMFLDLGLMLAPFKGTVEQQMNKSLDRLLEK